MHSPFKQVNSVSLQVGTAISKEEKPDVLNRIILIKATKFLI